MSDIFEQLKAIGDIFVAIWEFISGAFKGILELYSLFTEFLSHCDEVIASLPPVVAQFAFATVGILILYFVIGLVTGGES